MTAVALFLALSTVPSYYPVQSWPGSLEPIVSHWADAYGVPRFLARKVAEVESGWNRKAQSREWKEVRGIWKPGKVLARGLFQISVQYQAAHVRAAGMTHFDWRNPSDSACVGLRLLRWLLDRYDGDQMLSVAAFNAGPGRIESALPIPRETLGYLNKIFGGGR